MLVSSLLVTATSMSASSAPAWRSTVGNDARPCTVRMSRRSPRLRKRSASVSTTVMSLASPAKCSASVPPTCPAPRMMIFIRSLPLNRSAACGGDLDQFGVVEAIVSAFLCQQLAPVGLLDAGCGGEVQLARAAGTGEEGFDDLGVLGGQGRTGGVEQDAADFQGRPQRVEQFALQHGQGGDVVGLAGQLDVRVATDHAGGGARSVEQDGLERLAVPPGGGVAAIGGDQLGAQAQACEVFPHAHQALGFQVDGDDAGQVFFDLQDVTRLTAGGAAGVQHPLAWG